MNKRITAVAISGIAIAGTAAILIWKRPKKLIATTSIFKNVQSRVKPFVQPESWYECCGYEISEDGKDISGCKEILDQETVHRVIEVLGTRDLEGFSSSAGGSILSREFCQTHCPGNCDHECPTKITEDQKS